MAESTLEVEIITEASAWRGHEAALTRALAAAAAAEGKAGVVAVLLSDDAAIGALNRQFRDKAGATNVLSFPAPTRPQGQDGFWGDIVLAAETIAREANFQGKSFADHASHLVVHGFLHLLGYDHIAPEDAEAMEARERDILATLEITDPYA